MLFGGVTGRASRDREAMGVETSRVSRPVGGGGRSKRDTEDMLWVVRDREAKE
jgi:hypothetical protein